MTLGAKDGDSEGFTTREFNGYSFVQTPIDPCGPTQAQPALSFIVLQHWFGMPGSQGSPSKGRPPCMHVLLTRPMLNVGAGVGRGVGASVGLLVGETVGVTGAVVGKLVGESVGVPVKVPVGESVGNPVGAGVYNTHALPCPAFAQMLLVQKHPPDTFPSIMKPKQSLLLSQDCPRNFKPPPMHPARSVVRTFVGAGVGPGVGAAGVDPDFDFDLLLDLEPPECMNIFS